MPLEGLRYVTVGELFAQLDALKNSMKRMQSARLKEEADILSQPIGLSHANDPVNECASGAHDMRPAVGAVRDRTVSGL